MTVPTEEQVLAKLCSSAPTTDVRDCIRAYQHQEEYPHNLQVISKFKKAVLNDTLTYLRILDYGNKYRAEACVHKIICTIQCLLPDTCMICKEDYCTSLDDTPFLNCVLCGQGSHNACILGTIGLKPEDEAQITPEKVMDMINPSKMPGFHYLCTPCAKESIPDGTEGLMKKGRSTLDPHAGTATGGESRGALDEESQTARKLLEISQTDPVNQASTSESRDGAAEEFQTAVNGINTQTDLVDQANSTNTQGQAASTADQASVQEPVARQQKQKQQSENGPSAIHSDDICPYYKRNACRYGMRGKTGGQCNKAHPPACKKLLRHGTKGPKGCTAGKKCDKFHPPMCQSSLRKHECFNIDCKLVHTSGTRRIRPNTDDRPHDTRGINVTHQYSQHSEPPHNTNNRSTDRQFNYVPCGDSANPPQQSTFLEEALSTMRNEMREEMKNRISVVQTQPSIREIHQVLHTFKREIMEELNSRLPKYPSAVNNQMYQHGGQAGGGQTHPAQREVPGNYHTMFPRILSQ